jgi:rubrerythrin
MGGVPLDGTLSVTMAAAAGVDAVVHEHESHDPGPMADEACRGTSFELRCPTCGYGVFVRIAPARCPMCRGSVWEHPPTTARAQLL